MGITIQVFLVVSLAVAFIQGFVFMEDDKSLFTPYYENKGDKFDWELFQSVAMGSKENVLISPFPVKLLLSLLHEAASGKAKEELSKVYPGRKKIGQMVKIGKKISKDFELNMETRIYTKSSVSLSKDFMEIAENVYNCATKTINFQNGVQAAATINDWVEQATNGNIKDFITPDAAEKLEAALINAMFFKGKWLEQFNKKSTSKQTFYVNSTTSVQADIMFNRGDYYYADYKRLDAKVLRLPYQGVSYALTILLPNNPDGIDELIKKIKPGSIQIMQHSLEKVEVYVHIPKFKFTTEKSLINNLKHLKISEIFSGRPQYPGFGNETFQVSDVVQKAAIVVDEEGTEAAFATGAGITLYINDSEDFNAKHPFVFFIEEETTGSLLFAGKMMNPLE